MNAQQIVPSDIAANAASAHALAQALVFLAATCVVIPALRKARLSSVMGFLFIGVVMGPQVLGRLDNVWPWLSPFGLEESAPGELLAEMGVVFLLFIIGLEVSWDRLWALKRYIFGLGVAQVALCTIVIASVALVFGASLAVAVVLGLALALSSTAVVLQHLRERRQLTAPLGRAAFSVLLTQDLMVVPILFAVGALSTGFVFGPEQVGLALLSAVGAVIAITLVGRLLLRPLFRWVSSIESREAFVAAALFAAIGMSVAAEAAGLSMALGAFLAGLLLAETEFRHQIETDLEPLRDLLLGLFFVTVGMRIDLALLVREPLLILMGLLGLFALKALLIAPLARGFGMSWARAVELAFLLAGAGEFAFIVVATAQRGDVIAPSVAEYMLLVTALSLFMTPVMAWAGRRAAARLPSRVEHAPPLEAGQEREHVVIAGCGRVGQMLADILADEEIAHVGVDADETCIAALRKSGRPFYFGDASRRETLAALGAEHAAAIVITMDRPEAVEHIVKEAKAAWPSVPVYARARDAEQARRLRQAGADMASPDTVEAALQLGEALLSGVGVPDELVRRIIESRRDSELSKALSVSSST